MEIWKNIEETYGLYQISNCGRIKRKGYISETGKCYKEKIYDNMEMFRFTVDGKKAKRRIDTLVVKYFLCVHTNYRHINHKDFNPQNNHVDNLEVVVLVRCVIA